MISQLFLNTLKPKKNSKGVIILGMHRSGTSLVARVVKYKNFNCPNLNSKKDKTNKYGHYESSYAIKINDALLKCHGGNWFSIPKILKSQNVFKKIEERFFRIKLCIYLKKMSRDSPWFIKDPRMILTFNYWAEYFFDQRILKVCVFRNPNSVICSLMKRDNMDPFLARKLWKQYNLNLLKIINCNKNYILVDYDDLLVNPQKYSNLINNYLGEKKISISNYIDETLNHGNNSFNFLDSECEMIYQQLKQISNNVSSKKY